MAKILIFIILWMSALTYGIVEVYTNFHKNALECYEQRKKQMNTLELTVKNGIQEEKISIRSPEKLILELNMMELKDIHHDLPKLKIKFLDNEQRLEEIRQVVHFYCGVYGIDPNLIMAMIWVESKFENNATSKEGARGLMQILPKTGNILGVNDLHCPVENIEAGIRYFKSLLVQFNGDVPLALAAYNAGPTKVMKNKKVPAIKETREYVKKVLSKKKEYDLS